MSTHVRSSINYIAQMSQLVNNALILLVKISICVPNICMKSLSRIPDLFYNIFWKTQMKKYIGYGSGCVVNSTTDKYGVGGIAMANTI